MERKSCIESGADLGARHKERCACGNNHKSRDDICEEGAAVDINLFVDVFASMNTLVCDRRLHVEEHVGTERGAYKGYRRWPVISIHVEHGKDGLPGDHVPVRVR